MTVTVISYLGTPLVIATYVFPTFLWAKSFLSVSRMAEVFAYRRTPVVVASSL